MASVNKRKWTYKGITKEAWAVRYFDEKGVRRSKTFDFKKEAETFKRQAEREIEDGTHTPHRASVTIKRAAEEFLELQRLKLRDGAVAVDTLLARESTVNKWIVPHIGHVRVSALQLSDLQRLRSAMEAGGLDPYTARLRMGIFGSIERFARKRGYTRKEVLKDFWLEYGVAKPGRRRVPTVTEVRALLDAIDMPDKRRTRRSSALLNLTIKLAAFCGLRFGEIMGLTLASLDFDAGLIRIRQQMDRTGTLKLPKTAAGVRDVPMPSIVAEELRRWLTQFYVASPQGFVIRSPNGSPMQTCYFHASHWIPLLARAGFMGSQDEKRLHFHSLRHFNATMLVDGNTPLTEVAQMLGHSHFDMTLRIYAHPTMNQPRRLAAVEGIADKVLALTDARVTHQLLSA